MNLITILLLGVSLAMDAFAVTVAGGVIIKKNQIREAFKMSFLFGFFQTFMPLLGWWLGLGLYQYLSAIDHWLAFGLLLLVGAKMIREAAFLSEGGEKNSNFDLKTLLILAVATSLDALAVGLSLSVVGISLIWPAVIIGGVTFGLCFAGFFMGRRFGHFFENKIEIAGGLILIALGFKILMEHLI